MKIVTSKITKKSWLVNVKGQQITPKYRNISMQQYALFCVVEGYDKNKEEKKIHIFDAKTANEMWFGNIKEYTVAFDNILIFRTDKYWHMYAFDCNLLRRNIFDFLVSKRSQYILVNIQGKAYFMNQSLQLVSDCYKYLRDFDKFGYSVAKGSLSEMYYILNESMDIVTGPVDADMLKPLDKEFFLFWKNGLCGIIDKNRNEIIPAKYQEIVITGDNNFRLKAAGLYGMADRSGKIIMECVYDEII